MTDFAGLLRGLAASGVEFILVGGAAATVHGSVRLTLPIDVVYQRSPENIARLIAVKRAAGRPKDLEAVAELEAIEEERQRAPRGR